MTTYEPQPGDDLHWLADGVTFSTRPGDITGFAGAISRRGDTLTLTEDLLAANADRSGHTLFHLADDDERQITLYGKVLIRRGPWPSDADVYVRGSLEWAEAREKARRAAWAVPGEKERQEALRAVHDRFGAAPVTSTTFAAAKSATEHSIERGIREGSDDQYV